LATPIFVFRNFATIKMQNITKRAFLWELFGKIDFKNSQFHRLATLFWKLATLKRVATPSLRTAGLCDHFGPHYK
jgi:hypothetical protein